MSIDNTTNVIVWLYDDKINVHVGQIPVTKLRKACETDDVWISQPLATYFNNIVKEYRDWFYNYNEQNVWGRLPTLEPTIKILEKALKDMRRLQKQYPGHFHHRYTGEKVNV